MRWSEIGRDAKSLKVEYFQVANGIPWNAQIAYGMWFWRRGWDSNPRYPCEYSAFRVRCIRPLCHLSGGRAPTLARRGSRARCIAARARVRKPWPIREASANRSRRAPEKVD
jgi:hypothetical protein